MDSHSRFEPLALLLYEFDLSTQIRQPTASPALASTHKQKDDEDHDETFPPLPDVRIPNSRLVLNVISKLISNYSFKPQPTLT